MSGWGREPLSKTVSTEIKRREQILGKSNKTVSELSYVNNNTAWILLRSGINVLDDSDRSSDTLAKQYILSGGTLSVSGDNFNPSKAGFSFQPNNSNPIYTLGSLGYRPKPGITGLNIVAKDQFGCIMEADVKFTVWSLEDFEAIDTLFFKPGFPALLEFGHATILGRGGQPEDAGIQYIPNSKCFSKCLISDLEEQVLTIRESQRGNYEALIGYITNFSYTFDNGKWDCTLKILSKGTILEGLKIYGKSAESPDTETITELEGNDSPEESPYRSILEACKLRKSKTSIQDPANNFNSEVNNYTLQYSQPSNWEIVTPWSNVWDQKNTGNTSKIRRRYPSELKSIDDKLKFIVVRDNSHNVREIYTTLRNVLRIVNCLEKGLQDQGQEFYTESDNRFVTFAEHFSLNTKVAVEPKKPVLSTREQNTFLQEYVRKFYLEHYNDIIEGITEEGVSQGNLNSNNILDILVNFEMVVSTFESEMNEEGLLMNAIKSVLQKIQKAFGEINDFGIIEYPYAVKIGQDSNQKYISRLEIVDRNGIGLNLSTKVGEELPKLKASGLSTTFKRFSYRSLVSNEVSTEMSVAAGASTLGETEASPTLMCWKDGCRSRWKTSEETPTFNFDRDETLIVNISGQDYEGFKYSVDNIKDICLLGLKIYEGLNSELSGTVKSSKNRDQYCLRLEQLGRGLFLRYGQIYGVAGNLTGLSTFPIMVDITLKGIGGIAIGQCFMLDTEEGTNRIIPERYRDWGYIVTGVSHEIGQDGWNTVLKTQYFPRLSSKKVSGILRTLTPCSSSEYLGPEENKKVTGSTTIVDSSSNVSVGTSGISESIFGAGIRTVSNNYILNGASRLNIDRASESSGGYDIFQLDASLQKKVNNVLGKLAPVLEYRNTFNEYQFPIIRYSQKYRAVFYNLAKECDWNIDTLIKKLEEFKGTVLNTEFSVCADCSSFFWTIICLADKQFIQKRDYIPATDQIEKCLGSHAHLTFKNSKKLDNRNVEFLSNVRHGSFILRTGSFGNKKYTNHVAFIKQF